MFASLRDLVRPVIAPILAVALVVGLAVGAFAYAQGSDEGAHAREVAMQRAEGERAAERTAQRVAKAIAAADRADRAAAAEEAAQRSIERRMIARKAAKQEAAAAAAEADAAAAAAAEEASRLAAERAAAATAQAERRAATAAKRASRERKVLTGDITVPDIVGALVPRVGGFPGQPLSELGGRQLNRLQVMVDAVEDGKTFPCPLGSGGGYDDIVPGGRVVVEDGEGKVLATTSLTGGTLSSAGCTFGFEAEVPRAAFYEVAITHRGSMTLSFEEMESRGWRVSGRL